MSAFDRLTRIVERHPDDRMARDLLDVIEALDAIVNPDPGTDGYAELEAARQALDAVQNRENKTWAGQGTGNATESWVSSGSVGPALLSGAGAPRYASRALRTERAAPEYPKWVADARVGAPMRQLPCGCWQCLIVGDIVTESVEVWVTALACVEHKSQESPNGN